MHNVQNENMQNMMWKTVNGRGGKLRVVRILSNLSDYELKINSYIIQTAIYIHTHIAFPSWH